MATSQPWSPGREHPLDTQLQRFLAAEGFEHLQQALHDEPVVCRAVDAIDRSIDTISSLLELQGKQRPLRKGDVASMSECVTVAGVAAQPGHDAERPVRGLDPLQVPDGRPRRGRRPRFGVWVHGC